MTAYSVSYIFVWRLIRVGKWASQGSVRSGSPLGLNGGDASRLPTTFSYIFVWRLIRAGKWASQGSVHSGSPLGLNCDATRPLSCIFVARGYTLPVNSQVSRWFELGLK